MRKFPLYLLLLGLVVGLAACDSNDDDDDQTDAERFVGTWDAVAVEDNTGDRTDALLGQTDQFEIEFNADGTYTADVDFSDDDPQNRDDIDLAGGYTVNEAADVIALEVPGATLPFQYDFVDDDRVELTVSGALVNAVNGLFSTDYSGFVTITVER